MPNVLIPNSGISESVIRPAISSIVEDVLTFLRLKDKIKDIRYVNHNGETRGTGTALGEKGNDYANFSGTTRAWVEVDEDIFSDGYVTSRPAVIDTQPLFLDPALGVSIHPQMASGQSVIKIRFSTHSYDSVRQTREVLASKIAQLQDGIQHKIDFAIVLPNYALCLLLDIWSKRHNRASYNETFKEYIDSNSVSNLTTVSEASGEELSLVYKRRMGRVNGYFIVPQIPEKPTYEEGGSIWEMTFEYRVNFDIPAQMQVLYPISVHQQYLNPLFLKGLKRQTDIRDTPSNLSVSQTAAHLTEFGNNQGNNELRDFVLNIPDIDHFEPTISPQNTATIFIALLSIGPDKEKPNPRSLLLNLGDLGKIYIDHDILDFIRKVEYPWLNQLFKSFYTLSLYEGYNLLEPSSLECDDQLNIYATVPLDPRKQYRVRFSMVSDANSLSRESLERMWDFPQVVIKTTSAISEAVRHRTDNFNIRAQQKIEPWMFGPAWSFLIGKRPGSQINQDYNTDRAEIPEGVGFESGYKYPESPFKQLPKEFDIPEDRLKSSSTVMRFNTAQIQHILVGKKS